MVSVWSIWCEWDVGQENGVWSSLEKAKQWARDNEYLQEQAAEEGFDDVLKLEDVGLLTFNEVEVD